MTVSTSHPPIRVLVVDDHQLLRAGLVTVLNSAPDIEVVGEAGGGPDAVRLVWELEPDVVLMDVEMPGGSGLVATAAVVAERPTTRVLILTMFDLDEYVVAGLRAGAAGFLLKTTAPEALLAAIRSCAEGQTTLGSAVMERLVGTYLVGPAVASVPGLDQLTEREREVLLAMAEGCSNVEIARRLYLAETTVKTHVARVLAKLEVRDRLQAVVIAHRGGLRP